MKSPDVFLGVCPWTPLREFRPEIHRGTPSHNKKFWIRPAFPLCYPEQKARPIHQPVPSGTDNLAGTLRQRCSCMATNRSGYYTAINIGDFYFRPRSISTILEAMRPIRPIYSFYNCANRRRIAYCFAPSILIICVHDGCRQKLFPWCMYIVVRMRRKGDDTQSINHIQQ